MITVNIKEWLRMRTGDDLLEKVGLLEKIEGYATSRYPNQAKEIVIGETLTTVWCTSGRGKSTGIYVHFSFDDGLFRAHYRGKTSERIEDYKQV